MTSKCVCFFFCFIAVAVAQIPSLGFCPGYTPMESFDMNQFLGKWYEAERYFTFSDIGSRCVITDYAQTPSGRIYVSNEYTNRITGVKRVISGSLQQTGREGEGKLQVKYPASLSGETNLVVLDTDYDSYAVVWSCSGIGPVHAENAWVMTRERLPGGDVLQKAYGVLDRFRISHAFFIKTDQEGCALAASDLNAAQGISPISTVAEQIGEEQKRIKTPVKPKVKPETSEENETSQEEGEEEVRNIEPDPVAKLVLKTLENSEVKEVDSDVVAGEKQENKAVNAAKTVAI